MTEKSTKIKAELFNGFGFPLVLLDPTHREVQGEPILDLDYNKLQVQVLHELRQRGDYFGAELKFIRLALEQNYEEFGEFIGMTPEQIKTCEGRDLEFCGLHKQMPSVWSLLEEYCDRNPNPKTYKFLMTRPPEEQWE